MKNSIAEIHQKLRQLDEDWKAKDRRHFFIFVLAGMAVCAVLATLFGEPEDVLQAPILFVIGGYSAYLAE